MIALTDGPIDLAAMQAEIGDPALGAVVTFLGVTRNSFEGRPVLRLEYEAYPAMALAEMQAIAGEIEVRWPGARTAIVHRTGLVPTGEASVAIVVGTPHRAAAFEAARYAIDELKRRVPIWKKEVYADGHAWKANAPT